MVKDFFTDNRTRLSSGLTSHCIVMTAHALLQSSADLSFPFRQDSNFWYLTGIDEPDLILVIDADKNESTLLLPEQNDYQKEWEGENKTEEFTRTSGITKFGSIKSLTSRLKAAKKRGQKIGYLPPLDEIVEPFGFYSNPARRRVEKLIKKVDKNLVDIRMQLAKLRSVKQPEEIAVIQRAIDITGETLVEVKSKLDGFRTEKDIERAITAGFFARGADGHAYEPIVASGKNAATIHYTKNSQPIEQNTLLLLDVGALSGKYGADISRTWGVGTASARQRDVYNMTVEIQQEAMALLKPGVTIKEYQKNVESKIKKATKKLGITIEKYPHLISHFLGLDVHDAGNYSAPLEPGMVLTVEPGIYLADEGIGVRIEDDVLITKTGIKNLSKKIPKTL